MVESNEYIIDICQQAKISKSNKYTLGNKSTQANTLNLVLQNPNDEHSNELIRTKVKKGGLVVGYTDNAAGSGMMMFNYSPELSGVQCCIPIVVNPIDRNSPLYELSKDGTYNISEAMLFNQIMTSALSSGTAYSMFTSAMAKNILDQLSKVQVASNVTAADIMIQQLYHYMSGFIKDMLSHHIQSEQIQARLKAMVQEYICTHKYSLVSHINKACSQLSGAKSPNKIVAKIDPIYANTMVEMQLNANTYKISSICSDVENIFTHLNDRKIIDPVRQSIVSFQTPDINNNFCSNQKDAILTSIQKLEKAISKTLIKSDFNQVQFEKWQQYMRATYTLAEVIKQGKLIEFINDSAKVTAGLNISELATNNLAPCSWQDIVEILSHAQDDDLTIKPWKQSKSRIKNLCKTLQGNLNGLMDLYIKSCQSEVIKTAREHNLGCMNDQDIPVIGVANAQQQLQRLKDLTSSQEKPNERIELDKQDEKQLYGQYHLYEAYARNHVGYQHYISAGSEVGKVVEAPILRDVRGTSDVFTLSKTGLTDKEATILLKCFHEYFIKSHPKIEAVLKILQTATDNTKMNLAYNFSALFLQEVYSQLYDKMFTLVHLNHRILNAELIAENIESIILTTSPAIMAEGILAQCGLEAETEDELDLVECKQEMINCIESSRQHAELQDNLDDIGNNLKLFADSLNGIATGVIINATDFVHLNADVEFMQIANKYKEFSKQYELTIWQLLATISDYNSYMTLHSESLLTSENDEIQGIRKQMFELNHELMTFLVADEQIHEELMEYLRRNISNANQTQEYENECKKCYNNLQMRGIQLRNTLLDLQYIEHNNGIDCYSKVLNGKVSDMPIYVSEVQNVPLKVGTDEDALITQAFHNIFDDFISDENDLLNKFDMVLDAKSNIRYCDVVIQAFFNLFKEKYGESVLGKNHNALPPTYAIQNEFKQYLLSMLRNADNPLETEICNIVNTSHGVPYVSSQEVREYFYTKYIEHLKDLRRQMQNVSDVAHIMQNDHKRYLTILNTIDFTAMPGSELGKILNGITIDQKLDSLVKNMELYLNSYIYLDIDAIIDRSSKAIINEQELMGSISIMQSYITQLQEIFKTVETSLVSAKPYLHNANPIDIAETEANFKKEQKLIHTLPENIQHMEQDLYSISPLIIHKDIQKVFDLIENREYKSTQTNYCALKKFIDSIWNPDNVLKQLVDCNGDMNKMVRCYAKAIAYNAYDFLKRHLSDIVMANIEKIQQVNPAFQPTRDDIMNMMCSYIGTEIIQKDPYKCQSLIQGIANIVVNYYKQHKLNLIDKQYIEQYIPQLLNRVSNDANLEFRIFRVLHTYKLQDYLLQGKHLCRPVYSPVFGDDLGVDSSQILGTENQNFLQDFHEVMENLDDKVQAILDILDAESIMGHYGSIPLSVIVVENLYKFLHATCLEQWRQADSANKKVILKQYINHYILNRETRNVVLHDVLQSVERMNVAKDNEYVVKVKQSVQDSLEKALSIVKLQYLSHDVTCTKWSLNDSNLNPMTTFADVPNIDCIYLDTECDAIAIDDNLYEQAKNDIKDPSYSLATHFTDSHIAVFKYLCPDNAANTKNKPVFMHIMPMDNTTIEDNNVANDPHARAMLMVADLLQTLLAENKDLLISFEQLAKMKIDHVSHISVADVLLYNAMLRYVQVYQQQQNNEYKITDEVKESLQQEMLRYLSFEEIKQDNGQIISAQGDLYGANIDSSVVVYATENMKLLQEQLRLEKLYLDKSSAGRYTDNNNMLPITLKICGDDIKTGELISANYLARPYVSYIAKPELDKLISNSNIVSSTENPCYVLAIPDATDMNTQQIIYNYDPKTAQLNWQMVDLVAESVARLKVPNWLLGKEKHISEIFSTLSKILNPIQSDAMSTQANSKSRAAIQEFMKLLAMEDQKSNLSGKTNRVNYVINQMLAKMSAVNFTELGAAEQALYNWIDKAELYETSMHNIMSIERYNSLWHQALEMAKKRTTLTVAKSSPKRITRFVNTTDSKGTVSIADSTASTVMNNTNGSAMTQSTSEFHYTAPVNPAKSQSFTKRTLHFAQSTMVKNLKSNGKTMALQVKGLTSIYGFGSAATMKQMVDTNKYSTFNDEWMALGYPASDIQQLKTRFTDIGDTGEQNHSFMIMPIRRNGQNVMALVRMDMNTSIPHIYVSETEFSKSDVAELMNMSEDKLKTAYSDVHIASVDEVQAWCELFNDIKKVAQNGTSNAQYAQKCGTIACLLQELAKTTLATADSIQKSEQKLANNMTLADCFLQGLMLSATDGVQPNVDTILGYATETFINNYPEFTMQINEAIDRSGTQKLVTSLKHETTAKQHSATVSNNNLLFNDNINNTDNFISSRKLKYNNMSIEAVKQILKQLQYQVTGGVFSEAILLEDPWYAGRKNTIMEQAQKDGIFTAERIRELSNLLSEVIINKNIDSLQHCSGHGWTDESETMLKQRVNDLFMTPRSSACTVPALVADPNRKLYSMPPDKVYMASPRASTANDRVYSIKEYVSGHNTASMSGILMGNILASADGGIYNIDANKPISISQQTFYFSFPDIFHSTQGDKRFNYIMMLKPNQNDNGFSVELGIDLKASKNSNLNLPAIAEGDFNVNAEQDHIVMCKLDAQNNCQVVQHNLQEQAAAAGLNDTDIARLMGQAQQKLQEMAQQANRSMMKSPAAVINVPSMPLNPLNLTNN